MGGTSFRFGFGFGLGFRFGARGWLCLAHGSRKRSWGRSRWGHRGGRVRVGPRAVARRVGKEHFFGRAVNPEQRHEPSKLAGALTKTSEKGGSRRAYGPISIDYNRYKERVRDAPAVMVGGVSGILHVLAMCERDEPSSPVPRFPKLVRVEAADIQ